MMPPAFAACAGVRELAREDSADGAGTLHEDGAAGELRRAKGALDRRADRVQCAAGGAATAVSPATGRS